MKIENNSNLPVVRKRSFLDKNKEKLKNLFILALSLLGTAIPYVEGAVLPSGIQNYSTTEINNFEEENVGAKYEQALSDIGIKVNEEKGDLEIEDDPPEEKREKAAIPRPGDRKDLMSPEGDELLKFYNSLTLNVNEDVKLYEEFRNRHNIDNIKEEI